MRCYLLVSLALAAVVAPALGQTDTRLARLKEQGEWLAQECLACHKIDGSDKGIASIIGWRPSTFAATLKAYRGQEFAERRNPVMVSVARSLTDEEIEALAIYFGSISP
jgi:cytochrome c553